MMEFSQRLIVGCHVEALETWRAKASARTLRVPQGDSRSRVVFFTSVYKIISCLALCFLFAGAVSAQTRGKVEVVKDPRIDTLAAKRAELNKSVGLGQMMGFRVQLYSGSVRKDAYNIQARFQQDFPDIRSYVTYTEPNFKVRAGDFRTRMEAEKFQDQLKRTYEGTFIVTEKINPPQTEGNE
ncbi:MAG TPA: SPOR domain-containing protein [Mucilaginibacter sp.]|nr:SPOR domain-containing protein [Mucilaginibacter sp.]